eukprot:1061688-Amphidinium_carterae.1
MRWTPCVVQGLTSVVDWVEGMHPWRFSTHGTPATVKKFPALRHGQLIQPLSLTQARAPCFLLFISLGAGDEDRVDDRSRHD